MAWFCRVPWMHALFTERTVMSVRSLYRSDGARRYVDVETGLNKMTVGRFEGILARSNLQVQSRAYRCVKGLDVLGRLPGLREFFINQASCVLGRTPQECVSEGLPGFRGLA